MNTIPILIVLFKTVIISFIFFSLKIFGKKTATIYFIGVAGLFYLNPNIYIAENLLKKTVFLYFGYAFFYSFLKKIIFRKKKEEGAYFNKIKTYLSFFLAMFLYNSIFMIIFKNQKVSFVLSTVFFFAMEIFLRKIKNNNNIIELIRKNNILLFFISDIYFFINYSVGSLNNSILLVFLLFAFNIISDGFIGWCPINELQKGMISAEFVIKKNMKFVKYDIPMFINSIAKQKIMNNYFGKKEIISPFNSLTSKDIRMLKTANIKTLKIQKTINLYIFVILGILFQYILS